MYSKLSDTSNVNVKLIDGTVSCNIRYDGFACDDHSQAFLVQDGGASTHPMFVHSAVNARFI
jgi:hypothetical protein